MHLVFLNQYYPPDAAPTGVMLEAVAEECARNGHEVTVLCAKGGYGGKSVISDQSSVISEGGKENVEPRTPNVERRTSDVEPRNEATDTISSAAPHFTSATFNIQNSTFKIQIHRIRASRFGRGTFVGKLIDYASFYLGVAWKLGTMNPRPDRIVALTTPPYLSILARVMSKFRRGDHAHWVMDLYPDVMAAHGMLDASGLPYRMLTALARWGFGGKRCAAVMTLGPDMAERLRRSFKLQDSSFKQDEVSADPPSPSTFTLQPSTFNLHWVPLWGEGESRNEVGRDRRARPLVASGVERKGEAKDEPEDSSLTHPAPLGTSGTRPAVTPYRSLRRQRGWADDELVVMYSGNMGLGHRFSEILEVAAGLDRRAGPVVANGVSGENNAKGHAQDSSHAHSTPMETSGTRPAVPPYLLPHRFVFYGGGKRRAEIEDFISKHPRAAVELHDYVAAADLTDHLASADVHLVSLDPAWTGTMVPSKLQGVFAVGRPVIFIGSAESSLGKWVAESGGGWVVAPGDVDGLRVALEDARDPERRGACGQAAMAFAATHFDKATNVARVAEVFLG